MTIGVSSTRTRKRNSAKNWLVDYWNIDIDIDIDIDVDVDVDYIYIYMYIIYTYIHIYIHTYIYIYVVYYQEADKSLSDFYVNFCQYRLTIHHGINSLEKPDVSTTSSDWLASGKKKKTAR